MNVGFMDILIGFVTSLIMFGIGLTLTIKDFKSIFINHKIVGVPLFFQMVALPIIAFYICYSAHIKPEFKVGLIILACSPGGSTSGFITYLLKANVALSISLTAINSLLTLISIPLVVSMGLKAFMAQSANLSLPVLPTIIQIISAILIPTMTGLLIRHYKTSFAIKTEKIVKVIMIILLITIFIIKFFASEDKGGAKIEKADYISILPYCVIFNLTCIILGYIFIKFFHLDHKTAITTSVETSVHNTPLALLIAGTIIGNQEMVKPILIYSIFSFWTPLAFGYFANKLVTVNERKSDGTGNRKNKYKLPTRDWKSEE
ncbi:bile acid:sodium symporter family protein [Pseudoflavitalea sp. X16]|uniref:bile acid:sodium symporter family protein n=1 Tax=Paraflavitalea devenefica TaxID=2716334 RepID=UPI001420034A|nr:bile acid:sodium symporter [Paraflavitalea devenefica]NII28106.1 bile acid:sodium symporter family protein [Paraflavitalea devenefica]